MGEFVRLEVSDAGVGTLRLDRPKVNALNRRAAEEIAEAADDAVRDPSLRALVVWGGERVFAAGADVKEMAPLGPVEMSVYIEAFHDAFGRLERVPVVTIAAINGFALGGGCELALACDFRIGASDARLGQPEIALGVMPGAGGTQRLPRLVGPARAKDLIYSGRVVGAEEALSIGLLDRIAAPADVLGEATELAERYARGPTVALGAAKQAIQSGLDMDLGGGLLVERQAFASLFATADQKTGMRTFLEQGPGKATFEGR
ncbi:MAG TPA: enoyl-CoA hydratase-related protein [Actinomycetota bacterium]|nr:enoyl-CoA hydratase-related protein [Actinomycetota bacterium]